MKTNKTFNRQRLGAFHFISNVATNEFLYLYTTSIIVLVSYWSPSYLSNNVLLRRQCQSIPLTLGRLQEIQSSSYSSCCGFSIHCLSRFSVSVFVQSVSASRRERVCTPKYVGCCSFIASSVSLFIVNPEGNQYGSYGSQ